jgi:copper resistance protein B
MSTILLLRNARTRLVLAGLFAGTPISVSAQTTDTAPPAATYTSEAHDPSTHAPMQEPMSHDVMSMTPSVQGAPDQPPTTGEPEQRSDMGGMDMSGMDMSSMQGGRAPPDARNPDYSDSQAMSTMSGMAESMNDDAPVGKLLIDQLEYVDGSDANGSALDAQAYFGKDQDKLWLKADGEHLDGQWRDLRLEALWAHALTTFWDTQVGVRRDIGEGPDRSWAAFGVQGLAPYWFDVEATAYVGQSGRTAVRLEAEYELLLTQRLILTPDVEINAYGKSDPERQIGSGLSNIEFGLRLRYEFSRQFAPYIGIDWNRRLGNTADLVRTAGEPALDRAIVAGVRIWF